MGVVQKRDSEDEGHGAKTRPPQLAKQIERVCPQYGYNRPVAFYFVLNSTESSTFLGNRPVVDSIWNAIDAITLPSGTQWIGPVARITRRNEASFSPWKTDATLVLEVQGPYTPEAAQGLAEQVAASVDVALKPVSSDWSRTTVSPYLEAQEGPLAAWMNGTATTPRADHSTVAAAENIALDAQQYTNRVGQVLTNAVSPALQSTASKLIAAAAVVGVAFVVVKFWPRS